MTNVKFNKNKSADYAKVSGAIGTVYFTTDTHEIVVDGQSYGAGGGSSSEGHRYDSTHDSLAEGTNTSMGELPIASGNRSHAEGNGTTASGNASHAGGYGTLADVPYVTAIGRFNSYCDTNDLFVIGYGSDEYLQRRTVFKVSGEGNAGGSSECTVSVTGKVNASGGFFQTSDARMKNVLGDLDLNKAYDLIDKCQTILYTMKDDESSKEQIGLIAQEVQEFFPELISEDKNGNLSLDYARLTVIILKVLKDLIARVSKLESK